MNSTDVGEGVKESATITDLKANRVVDREAVPACVLLSVDLTP